MLSSWTSSFSYFLFIILKSFPLSSQIILRHFPFSFSQFIWIIPCAYWTPSSYAYSCTIYPQIPFGISESKNIFLNSFLFLFFFLIVICFSNSNISLSRKYSSQNCRRGIQFQDHPPMYFQQLSFFMSKLGCDMCFSVSLIIHIFLFLISPFDLNNFLFFLWDRKGSI
jgi:hypothetical protein